MKLRHILIGTALATATCNGAKPGETVYQTGFLSIEEAHKSIELPEGYSLELILSEPYIEEPVACAWDGNGVLYVVEMRTYMQTADATGEQEPRSRISRHEDTNGDGKYDKHSIFIDNILLPRMVLPLDDRVMVHITNTLDLWTYRDTNGDGKADEEVKIYEGGRRGGNMEHQPSGLIWNMDNWIYITYENRRYRFTDEKLVMERIPRGGGQWGIGQDDWGRIYFSTGGGENPAFFFQQPPVYGMLDLPGQTANDFRAVFPIAQIPDVQGGRGRVGSNGGLNRFTGCAGQGVFRGDRLPEDIRGDLFIPEPVGRLIRRAKVERVDAKTILTNATPKTEFIRTRDANFRPLGAETAPDGRMVFIDMHRGIIQQGNWTRKGSYLRGIIDKWGLDKNIGRGRLYRLVHKDFKAGPKPRMLDESTAQLVKHLSHPNGWWRDTAQKLIILRKDRDSVVPALVDRALKGESELGRAHALWTLEGIGAADSKTVAAALQDSSALVKVQALRVGEALIGEGDPAVVASLIQLGESRGKPNAEVATQLLNSITISGTDNADLHALADATVQAFPNNDAVKAVVRMGSSVRNQARAAAEARRKNAQLARSMEHGKVIFAQLCYTCHGADGKGTPVPDNPGQTLAPSMVKASRIIGSGNSLVRTILHGLTGPLDGKTYPGLMVPMNSQDDQWVADIATYVRNSFGNKASPITKGFVAAIRKSSGKRTTPWTLKELEALDPPGLVNRKAWKLTASSNAGECKSAIDGDRKSRWSTNTPQRAGQWFQIELPKRSTISEIQLDCRGSDNDYPRGYEVTVSLDGKKWSKALARGTGTNPLTIIGLPLGEAKFLRITQTGNVNGLFWSIHDLQVKGKEL